MLRSIAIALLACLPLTSDAQAKLPYFTPEVSVPPTDYITCPLVSSAMEALRQAYDQSSTDSLAEIILSASGKCTRLAYNEMTNESSKIVIGSTLATYSFIAPNGQKTSLYVHTYRQINWVTGRYEYMVTSTPLMFTTDQ